ncbi:unnamed protein product [Heterobilharzia americana]|nr:unnamed protein product [Heterobilharzia americana]
MIYLISCSTFFNYRDKLVMLDTVFILLSLFGDIYSLPEHKLKVPNSENVVDPCDPNKLVTSIGHTNYEGGGPLNPFGSDFEQKRSWDLLCSLDSDGDGFTNGQELGDPNCQWKVGGIPERTINITHPGVCTPVDSTVCKSKNICKYRTPHQYVYTTLPGIELMAFRFHNERVKHAARESQFNGQLPI